MDLTPKRLQNGRESTDGKLLNTLVSDSASLLPKLNFKPSLTYRDCAFCSSGTKGAAPLYLSHVPPAFSDPFPLVASRPEKRTCPPINGTLVDERGEGTDKGFCEKNSRLNALAYVSSHART